MTRRRVTLMAMVVASMAALAAAGGQWRAPLMTERATAPLPARASDDPDTSGHVMLTQDSWNDQLGKESFWRERRNQTPARGGSGFAWPWGGWGFNEGSRREQRGSGRALCVRLCDGYYYPASNSGGGHGLRGVAASCENTCATPARLFFDQSGGEHPEEMTDLSGARYKDLPAAFRYRQEYVASCKCKPDPWDEAALAKHRAYALAKAQGRDPSRISSGLPRDRGLAASGIQTGALPGGLQTGDRLPPMGLGAPALRAPVTVRTRSPAWTQRFQGSGRMDGQ